MTLISILIGLALEYFAGSLDHLRNFRWLDGYLRWIELKCSRYAAWEGPAGVLLTLAIPLLVLYLAGHVLGQINIGLTIVLSIAVFVYSLGPDLNSLISAYITALEQDDEENTRKLEARLLTETPGGKRAGNRIILSILLRSHDHIFGILFWYVVLGMIGALLFTLVIRLKDRFGELHGGYAAAVHNLYEILIWPSARLQALAFALGGSLVDALEGWRNVEGDSFSSSRKIIISSGLGAMQYYDDITDNDQMSELEWISEAQALVNRTLIVWLTVLGIMTLGGFLR